MIKETLLPELEKLSRDRQWRVRMAILQILPLLATIVGERAFTETLWEKSESWLGDPVHKVREAAAAQVKGLVEILGPSWAKEHVLGKVGEWCWEEAVKQEV